MCVLIFSTNFFCNISILRRNEQDMIINLYWSSCKVPIFVSDFNFTWNFFVRILKKKNQISTFMEIRSVGAEFFYLDGRKHWRTDITKLIIAFSKFSNVPGQVNATHVCMYIFIYLLTVCIYVRMYAFTYVCSYTCVCIYVYNICNIYIDMYCVGGKQWQPTPKNLPRMQCARAIPVAWLGSGSC
jgi:hypothetical protein